MAPWTHCRELSIRLRGAPISSPGPIGHLLWCTYFPGPLIKTQIFRMTPPSVMWQIYMELFGNGFSKLMDAPSVKISENQLPNVIEDTLLHKRVLHRCPVTSVDI